MTLAVALLVLAGLGALHRRIGHRRWWAGVRKGARK